MAFELEDNTRMRVLRTQAMMQQAPQSKMVTMLIKSGIVKDEKGATKVLLIGVVLICAISVFIFMQGTAEPAPIVDSLENVPLSQ